MTSPNPLIAPPADSPVSPWAGIWIAEDIELIIQGVQSGSWVDTTLGAVSAGLDALAFVSDPIGGLLQYGIAWLIDHVKQLSQPLDWLAGDPGAIAGHAQTWRNVAGSLATEAEALARSVRWDVSEWTGVAGDAYRTHADHRAQSLRTLGRASEAMALMVEAAGVIIGTVRVMVRDAIATVVSRLIVYAGELIASVGTAAPLVVEQVSTLCASWAARIARWLKSLIASLRNLGASMSRLERNIDHVKGTTAGRPAEGPSSAPGGGERPDAPGESPDRPTDPELEAARVHALGMDTATGKFRPGEAETAVRIEDERGVTLKRASHGSSADWVDDAGRSYDAVGNFPPQYFDQQWPQFQFQIERHLDKADLVPVDVSKFTPDQVARIEQFIADRNLAPRVFILGK